MVSLQKGTRKNMKVSVCWLPYFLELFSVDKIMLGQNLTTAFSFYLVLDILSYSIQMNNFPRIKKFRCQQFVPPDFDLTPKTITIKFTIVLPHLETPAKISYVNLLFIIFFIRHQSPEKQYASRIVFFSRKFISQLHCQCQEQDNW